MLVMPAIAYVAQVLCDCGAPGNVLVSIACIASITRLAASPAIVASPALFASLLILFHRSVGCLPASEKHLFTS